MYEDIEYKEENGMTGTEQEAADETAEAVAGEPELFEIIGVTFKSAGKIYYFDASGITARAGQCVIVDTSRGLEYGKVALANRMVPSSDLVLPLRRVIRIADRDDDDRYRANCEKEEEAFAIGLKKIAEHGLNMKLIEVEYTFDNAKLLFYFTSEERVDFRELVKDLASIFRTRIELRQIGLRDEAKIIGGYGICGREFCCHSFLGDFVQVSIKMAKEQNLALNASKISGACGRLMCCLRYEHEAYQEELKLLPKVDSKVLTPDGEGTVTEVHPLTGLVKVRLDKEPDKNAVVYDKTLLRTTDGKPICPVKEDSPSKQPSGKKNARTAEPVQKVTVRIEPAETSEESASDGAEKESAPKERKDNTQKKNRRRQPQKAQPKHANSYEEKEKKIVVHKQHSKTHGDHKKNDNGSQKQAKAVKEESPVNARHGGDQRETEAKNAAGRGEAQAQKNESAKKKNNKYRRHGNRHHSKNSGNEPNEKS